MLITILTFYHALLYPVTYWDSLILYTHYGEMTYREQGFPVRVCAQVGLGLGANYPHYYPLTSATLATFWGGWDDLYAQMFPPLAGLISVVLLYDLLLTLFESRRTAILVTLLFRSFAYATCYFIWATDYALVMMLATAILWLCQRILNQFRETSIAVSRREMSLEMYVVLTVALVAFAMHINYLGIVLVIPLLVTLLHIPNRPVPAGVSAMPTATNVCSLEEPGFFRVLFPRRLRASRTLFGFGILIACGLCLLGGSWYLRNWIVTGNPVYAFFPRLLGGRYVDLDVLASCAQEWTSNGDGVARFGSTLQERILRSPEYFLLQTNWHWKFGPTLFGLCIPGIFLIHTATKRVRSLMAVAGSLLLAGLVFEYFISGLYLYHILFVTPCLSCLSGVAVHRLLKRRWSRRYAICLVLLIGLTPGLSMALVGPKLMSFDLKAFRCPGIDKDEFWSMCFQRDQEMWRTINDRLPLNAGVLTHENRYHVFRRDIRIVHGTTGNSQGSTGSP
ncbi:MAG TPA: hypothetical protein PKH07_16310, partial [bacterium]|nr:hypothetical protein [bacterium]